eukprot:scaffold118114_cov16-Prasinocladus_malaysianus.AAC.1
MLKHADFDWTPQLMTDPVFEALAVDISLAALLGENVYSFGDLLQHPIVSLTTRICVPIQEVLFDVVIENHAS